MARSQNGRRWRWALASALFVAVLAYASYFAWLATSRHDALLTHTADLGQIDLAIWNTAHGRFVQEVKGEVISTRLTDHFEPAFLPISLIFYLWDDPRALLTLQAVVLALGALPVFAFVMRHPLRVLRSRPALPGGGQSPTIVWAVAAWAGLAYLLAPQGQAANLADFHAAPLAAFPLALLLVLGQRRRLWPALVVAAACLAIKEEIALLVLAAGLYFVFVGHWRPGWIIALVAAAWFAISMLVVIPHYSQAYYGLDRSPYLARYEESGNTLVPAIWQRLPALLSDRARWSYLLGLLVAFAGMPLLAPEIALVAAPLLVANLVSNYSAMYSGEFHYTAPFLTILACAAGVGARRWLRLFRRQRGVIQAVAALPLLILPLGYQVLRGYTPAGSQFAYYRAAAGAHQRLLARFAEQIPSQAPLSTTPALQPHFSHRQLIYTFPAIGQAQYILLDAAGTTDMHPADFHNAYLKALESGFGVVDAADGFVLLRRGQPPRPLPDTFYSFARATQPPQHPLSIQFGASLRLVGYDWLDDPKWQQTQLRLYWQALGPLDDRLVPYVLFTDQFGRRLADSRDLPLIEPLWCPPSMWLPGETIMTTTVAGTFGPSFEAYVAVGSADQLDQPAARLQPISAGTGAQVMPNLGLVRLPPMARVPDLAMSPLAPGAPPPPKLARLPEPAVFGASLRLVGSQVSLVGHNSSIETNLFWQRLSPLPDSMALSLRLLDDQSKQVAQWDGPPHGGLYPPSVWHLDEIVADQHRLPIPVDLKPGAYRLMLVAYDRATLAPLPLADGGTQFSLGIVALPREERR